MPRIPTSKIKSLPDIFSHITYKEVAKALQMKPITMRRYVTITPEKFRLEDVYKMAEFLEVDKWWLMEKVHGWCRQRAD